MKIFYGWFIVAIACICYGLGISPAYYSWGYFFPELQAELGFTKTDLGAVFGLFTFLYSGVGPLVGVLQRIIGVRACMTIGSIMAAVGFVIVSQADEMWHFFLGFSVLGGCGIGMSTIIPCQTLGQNWFLKRRALVIAIIMSFGGIVGFAVPLLDTWIIENFQNTWRTGWQIVAGISMAVAVLAAICIRDTPEKMGLLRDGAKVAKAMESAPVAKETDWSPWEAIRTRQFVLVTLAGIAYATPWGVIVAHGRLHLTEQGFELSQIGLVMGSMAILSIIGRLSGIAGDILNPKYVIVVGLILEGLGAVGFFFAKDAYSALACLFLVALGFGSTYVCIPVVFSDYFGRRAFGTTAGTRMLITGVFNGLGPWLTGMVADRMGYFIPFASLTVLCFIGAFAMSICSNPGNPPSMKTVDPEPATA